MHRKLVCLVLLALFGSTGALAQNQPQQPRPPANQPAPAPAQPAPAAPSPRSWQTATSKDGGFSVDLPAKAVEKRIDLKDAKGQPITSFLQEVTLDANQTYFGTVWTRIPLPADEQAVEKKLTSVRDGTRVALKGTLITTRPIRQGKFLGLDYVIEAGPKATRFRYRSFIVGDRLIQLVYSGKTGSENSAEVRKFHDSLKLQP